ncbi:DUF3820 family protein [Aquimarina sp. ERC-38]|uniref:DUF3820 family protein n=1 Tax=Aquimarina sp. ERC-38 TaxID=2949996 RepID=UPI002246E043|nr:DUF3820 family protein [Aquimarina sp. ERC-38]UZO79336.1 DUF3820 family protein [Aquimarina sp. ERC-38]
MPSKKPQALPDITQQKEFLKELASAKMPFGKYKDHLLINLPEYYLVWFSRKGFPKGKLGLQMQSVYELQLNGLTHLVKAFKEF